MKTRILSLIFFVAGLALQVQGQDPQFTQFYAAPLYHNPAFTGSGYAPRIILNYRNQWPSLNANFKTSVVSVDNYFEKQNSGLGIMLIADDQGNSVKNREINLLYAYQIQLSEKNFFRLGLQGGYSFRSINPTGLIFGDQLGANGYIGPSNDPFAKGAAYPTLNVLDVGTGGLFYNSKVFIGLSLAHLTQPALNYQVTGTNVNSQLNRKLMINGGYNFNLNHLVNSSSSGNKEFVITPTFLYKKQGPFSQLDLGAYATYSPLTLGLSYRGIPLKKVFTKFPNQDAFAALVGFRFDNFSVGYSYDLTISGLGASSGGSHEFSLSYQLDKGDSEKSPYQRQRKKELACPKF